MVDARPILIGLFVVAAVIVLVGKGLVSKEPPDPGAPVTRVQERAPTTQPRAEPPEGAPTWSGRSAQQPAPPEAPKADVAKQPTAVAPAKLPAVKPLTGNKLSACLKSGKPTLADFGSGWCAECKRQAPVLDEAATRFQGRANVVFVSVDDYADLARRYRVATIPCQILFDAKGQEASRHIGFMPLEAIAAELTRLGVK